MFNVDTSSMPEFIDSQNLYLESWKLKLDSVQPAVCDSCGGERRWGIGIGRYHFCDKHNSWRNYLSLCLWGCPT